MTLQLGGAGLPDLLQRQHAEVAYKRTGAGTRTRHKSGLYENRRWSFGATQRRAPSFRLDESRSRIGRAY